jgi:prepilin-type N-terminal cleavage/methylation domain-containing protein
MCVKNQTQKHYGLTLIEVLVVMTILAILIAILIPAVQYSREASRRLSCSNNLKQIGTALNNYESTHSVYPQGTNGLFSSGHMMLLPFLEQTILYNSINFGSSGIPGGYLIRRLINAPSSAFPRFRTL